MPAATHNPVVALFVCHQCGHRFHPINGASVRDVTGHSAKNIWSFDSCGNSSDGHRPSAVVAGLCCRSKQMASSGASNAGASS